ncbi:glycosyltransferase family 2 protein [Mycena leptocephala]|nr:glycosyltransferase family 2 protein [Mycena leptocephala]
MEAVTDLATLQNLSDDVIVACLRERFMTDSIYTNIGSSGLVALNPHKYVNTSADSVMHKRQAASPAHIFQLANNAYYHMRRTTQDQSIIFTRSGETASGKSENRRLAIKTLLELSVSNPGKKGSKLATQVPASEFVLESFGNARTLFNPNASRFGKYTELQFSDRGRLQGIKTLDYYLERNRVAGAPNGERNFHIFYYLVAGATPEERQHLHLLDKTTYRYLGQHRAAGAPNARPTDDAMRFDQLKLALKTIGLSKRHVAQTCQLVAAILHLGNLEFTIDRHRNEDAAVVRNTDICELVADFLGVHPGDLEQALSYKTKLVKKELCTVFLDPDGASDNRDDLAKTLYSLLFAWLNEHINQRLCKDDFATFIGLFDLPGPQNLSSRPNSLDQFCINFANERLHAWTQHRLFEFHVAEYTTENLIPRYVPPPRVLRQHRVHPPPPEPPGRPGAHMDDQARRAPKKTDTTMVEAFQKRWGNHSSFKAGRGRVPHTQPRRAQPDFVSLLRGEGDGRAGREREPLRQGLFSGRAIATQAHPRNEDTIVAAQQPVKPLRAPSTRRKNAPKRSATNPMSPGVVLLRISPRMRSGGGGGGATSCVAGAFRGALDTLFATLDETQAWHVAVRSLGLSAIAQRSTRVYEVGMTLPEFVERYETGLEEKGERVEQARRVWGLGEGTWFVGCKSAFHKFEDQLRAHDVEETKRNRMRDAEVEGGVLTGGGDPYAPYATSPALEGEAPWAAPAYPFAGGSSQALPLVSHVSPFQRADMYEADDAGYDERGVDAQSRFTSAVDERETASNFGSESYAPSRNMFGAEGKGAGVGAALLDKDALAGRSRRRDGGGAQGEQRAQAVGDALLDPDVWVPNPLLSWCGRMKRIDVRQAWREKLALNILIWLSHRPREVFDLNTITSLHTRVVGVVPSKTILKTYGGSSADNIFPVQVSALCNGVDGGVSPYVVFSSSNNTDQNSQYHDFRFFTNDSRPDWYFESMVQMRWTARRGFVGYTPKEIRTKANNGSSIGVYNGLVYDLTDYVQNPRGVKAPTGENAPDVDRDFMSSYVVDIFKLNAGGDVTKDINNLVGNGLNSEQLARQKLDTRESAKCIFSTYLLLILSIIMVSVIGFKFLASISLAGMRAPEDHDKFVICQVPCYTEGDQSLRRTIDSLAQLKYDDKRKLLLIICDGMIVGSGNDRPTPRIVLDILGADPNLDPEPLSFLSLGEGAKQHNMGKVYSGLYECKGHVVPYLVIAKVGKPTERSRPGNRGKRDSQMLLMHFLNKVHFNSPMNPLELEMYHQIKNVIGVNPTFYEYVFMVDADTTVDQFSVNRLISSCVVRILSAPHPLLTPLQVYEYFISHNMAKAFESLFGSVTCLPGCFTLYRLRTTDTHKPLLISNQLIQDYSENRVDTLHMKNLLHLGEDRYLTTLLLKHFPTFKTQFVRDAHAYTVAPDDWKILLSQRRRWINSTVHNLGELVFLEQLCGFCCFSMRFIVMIDLVSTLTQPVTVAYIAYLVYLVVAEGSRSRPSRSLRLYSSPQVDMIGWMFFYILAIPVFSFMLPLYSFWRMDDFSWGQTRVVLGESGKKMIVHDEGKFDPRVIPLKSWNDYENELWDKESNHSIGSWVPPPKLRGEGYAESQTASLYGRETTYEPRSYSPAPSRAGGYASMQQYPLPGYQSGRNTPQSMFHPMSESRPMTNYLDVPIPTSGSPDDLDLPPGAPTEAELDRAVQEVLRNADLNSITKREIRRRLEARFGMDLTSRKATINAAIDRILLSHA